MNNKYASKPVNPKYFRRVILNPCNEIDLTNDDTALTELGKELKELIIHQNSKKYNRTEIAKEMDPVLRLMKNMGYDV